MQEVMHPNDCDCLPCCHRRWLATRWRIVDSRTGQRVTVLTFSSRTKAEQWIRRCNETPDLRHATPYMTAQAGAE